MADNANLEEKDLLLKHLKDGNYKNLKQSVLLYCYNKVWKNKFISFLNSLPRHDDGVGSIPCQFDDRTKEKNEKLGLTCAYIFPAEQQARNRKRLNGIWSLFITISRISAVALIILLGNLCFLAR